MANGRIRLFTAKLLELACPLDSTTLSGQSWLGKLPAVYVDFPPDISRSSYQSRPVSPGDLVPMRRIGELHLDCPFVGDRMLRDLMKRMGIEAIYRTRRA